MSAWPTLKDIRKGLLRKWKRGSYSKLPGPFPLRVPMKGPKASELTFRHADVDEWLQAIVRENKQFSGAIEWRSIQTRQLGQVQLPKALLFENAENLVAFLGTEKEWESLGRLRGEVRKAFPDLEPWIAGKPTALLALSDKLDRLLSAVGWIVENPDSGLFLRQLSLPDVDTKFVERNKGVLNEWLTILLPDRVGNTFEEIHGFRQKPQLLRLGFPDSRLAPGGFSQITVPIDELAKRRIPAKRFYITENDMNAVAFPTIPDSFVVFGRGFQVEQLKCVPWMADMEIFYWGDIDTHGFAILSSLRAVLPHVKSFLMDRKTFLAHRASWVTEPKPTRADLQNLTNEEWSLYDDLRTHRFGERIRLEQEFIRYDYLKARLGLSGSDCSS